MKYTAEMSSVVMIYTPIVTKTGSSIPKLMRGRVHRHTGWRALKFNLGK
jgi:hypothetical protein